MTDCRAHRERERELLSLDVYSLFAVVCFEKSSFSIERGGREEGEGLNQHFKTKFSSLL